MRGPDVPLDIDCMRFADIRVQVKRVIIIEPRGVGLHLQGYDHSEGGYRACRAAPSGQGTSVKAAISGQAAASRSAHFSCLTLENAMESVI